LLHLTDRLQNGFFLEPRPRPTLKLKMATNPSSRYDYEHDFRGMKHASTLLCKTATSTGEIGNYILQLTKFQPHKLVSLMDMASGRKFVVEFVDAETKDTFEKICSDNQTTNRCFSLKKKPMKTHSILCCKVPGSYSQEKLEKFIFGEQTPRVVSREAERQKDDAGNPLWFTGRRWINVLAGDFDKLRRIPTDIRISRDWKISIHLQKGPPKKCHFCKEDGHMKQQCVKPRKQPEANANKRRRMDTPTPEKQVASHDDGTSKKIVSVTSVTAAVPVTSVHDDNIQVEHARKRDGDTIDDVREHLQLGTRYVALYRLFLSSGEWKQDPSSDDYAEYYQKSQQVEQDLERLGAIRNPPYLLEFFQWKNKKK